MIYILVIAALVIINFTNVITRIQSKEYKNKLEIFIIDNYKYLFGLTFILFSIFFCRNSCFFLDFDC